MVKIISAMDYGYRKLIRVCMNPEQPGSVHEDGTEHTGSPPAGTDPNLKAWEWCHDCRYNWQVRELTWTGEEMFMYRKDGTRRLKTNSELLAEIREQLSPAAAVS